MPPYVIVHNEISLDARMDALNVDMRRFYGLAATWREDCTLVGTDTLLAATPDLALIEPATPDPSAQEGGDAAGHAPILAVVDSRGRLPGVARLRDQPYWRASSLSAARQRPRRTSGNVRTPA